MSLSSDLTEHAARGRLLSPGSRQGHTDDGTTSGVALPSPRKGRVTTEVTSAQPDPEPGWPKQGLCAGFGPWCEGGVADCLRKARCLVVRDRRTRFRRPAMPVAPG